MIRSLIALSVVASPALADTGLHHHPHGIEGGWILLALVGAVAGFGLARLWGRK